MKAPWDPNQISDTIVDQVTDGMEYVSVGNNAYPSGQDLTIAYNVVFNTKTFADDCRRWSRGPKTGKTWGNFKTHFTTVHREIRKTSRNARAAGYNANFMSDKVIEETENETVTALENLATAELRIEKR